MGYFGIIKNPILSLIKKIQEYPAVVLIVLASITIFTIIFLLHNYL